MVKLVSSRMKNSLRALAFAGLASVGLALGSASANATAVHLTAADILALGLTVDPSGFFDSAWELKADFGDLGDASVLDAMNDADWFGDAGIVAAVNVGSGNCGSGVVTCSGGSGTYTGTSNTNDDGNLFVVHVGGKGGGSVYAFLYTTLIDDFSISGFKNGVSWIRAYTAPSYLDDDPPEVPIPGALPLLLTGLAGVGFLGRIRRKVS